MVRESILPISLANAMQPILYFFDIQYVAMYSSVIITKAIAKMHEVERYKESIF